PAADGARPPALRAAAGAAHRADARRSRVPPDRGRERRVPPPARRGAGRRAQGGRRAAQPGPHQRGGPAPRAGGAGPRGASARSLTNLMSAPTPITFKTTHRIRFSDLDPYNHLTTARYAAYYVDHRMEGLRDRIGWDLKTL